MVQTPIVALDTAKAYLRVDTTDPEEGSPLQYGGELNINANYTDHAGNEFTADTQIEVADVEEMVFTALSHPTQKEGAALDLSGAVLAVNYSDGTSRPVDAANG